MVFLDQYIAALIAKIKSVCAYPSLFMRCRLQPLFIETRLPILSVGATLSRRANRHAKPAWATAHNKHHKATALTHQARETPDLADAHLEYDI